jgi:hypothetical protein
MQLHFFECETGEVIASDPVKESVPQKSERVELRDPKTQEDRPAMVVEVSGPVFGGDVAYMKILVAWDRLGSENVDDV